MNSSAASYFEARRIIENGRGIFKRWPSASNSLRLPLGFWIYKNLKSSPPQPTAAGFPTYSRAPPSLTLLSHCLCFPLSSSCSSQPCDYSSNAPVRKMTF
ncbi:hypothetical protein V6N13_141591 [Hibiscus sabdariffa]|uniref:Uncharacterized protein n=2 Tax=Hibiscus sabdariffa TaxID=183260 RepID=A0ABR2P5B4_9ROSI